MATTPTPDQTDPTADVAGRRTAAVPPAEPLLPEDHGPATVRIAVDHPDGGPTLRGRTHVAGTAETTPEARGDASAAGAPVRHRPARSRVYDRPVVAGRVVSDSPLVRLQRWLRERLTTEAQRQEIATIEALEALPRATRPNIVPIMSPKGGVGKTSMTFVLGTLLAGLGHRVVAVDTNPDRGTLGRLVPTEHRAPATLEHLLERMDSLDSQAQVGDYVSRLRGGLHVLAGPRNPEVLGALDPTRYGRLVAFLSRFYEVVLLDMGTGINEPIPRFALGEAHQVVVVGSPDWNTLEITYDALDDLAPLLGDRPRTVALNKAQPGRGDAVGANLTRELGRTIGEAWPVPMDERLRLMLDSGTYELEDLPRATRHAIRLLGLAVGERIV